MRIEDIDGPRCKPEFATAALEDLRWLGLEWTEGPDVGGPHGPYVQSERTGWYLEVWRRLEAAGVIYPSPHSRRDVEAAATAPHEAEAIHSAEAIPAAAPPHEGEPLFPTSLRPHHWDRASAPGGVPWRFRVPDGCVIEFTDAIQGPVRRTAGIDFGDFVVWRRDDFSAYELAVVADDHAMAIEEVVRGADLLTSTARQLLIYEALGWEPPAFAHAPLVCDSSGRRLAKRFGAAGIRELRAAGWTPDDVLTRPLS
jgi:glutamyl-tRNA synthetase